jgi:hypothetical protein
MCAIGLRCHWQHCICLSVWVLHLGCVGQLAVLLCLVLQGVAFSDALDRRPAYIPPPGVDTVEAVQAAAASVWGEVGCFLSRVNVGGVGCDGECASMDLQVGAWCRRHLPCMSVGLQLNCIVRVVDEQVM